MSEPKIGTSKRKRDDEWESDEEGMQCWAVTPDGEEHPLVVGADDTVSMLVLKVKRALGEVDMVRYVLSLGDRELSDPDEPLADIGIEAESRIDITYTQSHLAMDALQNKYKVPPTCRSLRDAIIHGNLELVKALLAAGVDPSSSLEFIYNGNHGVDFNSIGIAAKYGQLGVLKHLMKMMTLCEVTYTSHVISAIGEGHTEVALYLLAQPLHLDSDLLQDPQRTNLRVYTSSADKRVEYMVLFDAIAKKLEVDVRKKGCSIGVLRMVAAGGADVELIQLLEDAGVDIFDADSEGENVLSTTNIVCRVVLHLIRRGVKPTAEGWRLLIDSPMTLEILQTLQAKGHDPPDMTSVLHQAVCNFQLDIVRHLIDECGVDPNVLSCSRENALHKLAQAYEKDSDAFAQMLTYLMSKGVSTTQKCYLDSTPLDTAAEFGCVPMMQAILQEDGSNHRSIRFGSLPYDAPGFYDYVLTLSGVDLNHYDDKGYTVASIIAEEVDAEEAERLLTALVAKGANVNKVPDSLMAQCHNAMLSASEREDTECVRVMSLLQTLGGDINVQLPDGRCPLHVASTDAMIRYLLSQPDIEPNARDWWGQTPLLYHMFKANQPTAGRTFLWALLESCCAAKADLNARDIFGNAAIFGCYDLRSLRAMLALGADHTVLNSYGVSLLSWAGNMEMLRFEISELGLDPHHRDSNGMTVLMHLVLRGVHDGALDEFVSLCGADMDAVDNDGNTVPMLYMQKYRSRQFEARFKGKPGVVDRRNKEGKTAFHYCRLCREGEWVATVLKESKVRDNNRETPLMCYVQNAPILLWKIPRELLGERSGKTGKTVLMMLLENTEFSRAGDRLLQEVDFAHPDIDLNDEDHTGKTLFMYMACYLADCEWPRDVIDKVVATVDVNRKDTKGNTAAHHAAQWLVGFRKWFGMPFNKTADLMAVNNEGDNLLMVVLKMRGPDRPRVPEDEVKYLDARCPGILDVANAVGEKPWQYLAGKMGFVKKMYSDAGKADRMRAYSKGWTVCLDWTLEQVSVNDRDADGRTLLHYACMHGLNDVYRLLGMGADPDVRDGKGRTPLFYVFCVPHMLALKMHNADPNVRDVYGCTAMDQAQFGNNPELLSTLHFAFPTMQRGNPSHAAHRCSDPDVLQSILTHPIDWTYTHQDPEHTYPHCPLIPPPIVAEVLKVSKGLSPPRNHHIPALMHFFDSASKIADCRCADYCSILGFHYPVP